MNELKLYEFNSAQVRVVSIENESYFVASDVAKVLEYSEPHKAVSAHCKNAIPLKDIDGINYPVYTNQGLDEKAKLIKESDVYRLTMKSKMDRAEEFQDWIVEEVLPSIRKTGSYSVAPMSAGEILLAQAQALIALEKAQEEQQRRTALLEAKTQEVAERLDHIETATNHFTIMGWCSMNKRSVAVATAASMGKLATKECKARKLEVGKTPDPRFGLVSTYPKFLLDELFLEE
jgi:prophage antirepressor-like protein